MKTIYEYMNYREFLNDFYLEKKAANPGFSYQVFANKAGFKSKSFIKLVISGKKNLTEESASKINQMIKLSPKAFSYFLDLIAFNQAKSLELRNIYFDKLASYNSRSRAKKVLSSQYDFYSKWYHNTIRELATILDTKGKHSSLAKRVIPRITVSQAKKSIELLVRLGLLQKAGKKFRQTDNLITTGDDVKSLAAENFYVQNLEIAKEAITRFERDERDISCLILGLSQEGYKGVKKEIQVLRKKLLEIADLEKNPERVYHVNFQAFPTSEKLSERGKDS